ncbi:MAG TPA: D-alanyl-D-alanine carboxypeptidase/D-alanyl-D-alanine-endopeptidase [Bdellovibrionota bacterium]|nr:D-alanyl-D-alanine carboxypeptidase/D-alanyl-D-alanine-endopeptidase [Bdellovibrionota bacterium]
MTPHRRALTWLMLLFALIPSARAADGGLIASRIMALLNDPALRGIQISAEVKSLTRDKVFFERGSNVALIPASSVKLLSAYLALKRLGPDHVFTTKVLRDADVAGSTLKGNLYLRGAGDPSLVSERMYILAESVARTGLRKIEGDLVVDASAYSDGHFHANRLKTDSDRPFNAPTSAVSFNYNTTAVYMSPGPKPGSPVRVTVEPDTGYVRVVNHARTGKAGSKNTLQASREGLGEGKGDEVIINGSLAAGENEKLRYFNVTDPETYAGMALRFYLKKEGVTFGPRSRVRLSTAPPDTPVVAEVDSLPVREIVTLMNKYSNNFIAEALVKAVGGLQSGYPTSLDQGMKALVSEAQQLGLQGGGFTLTSPSGLNRENHMSAAHFMTLLTAAWKDLGVMPELVASLPIAGKDGTLERRAAEDLGQAEGRARAKTGTLDGVSALAGLIQAGDGEVLAYALLLNTEGAPDLRPWQNRFLRLVAQ